MALVVMLGEGGEQSRWGTEDWEYDSPPILKQLEFPYFLDPKLSSFLILLK